MSLSFGCLGSSGEQKGRRDEWCWCSTNRLEISRGGAGREGGEGLAAGVCLKLHWVHLKNQKHVVFSCFYHQWGFFFAKMGGGATKKGVLLEVSCWKGKVNALCLCTLPSSPHPGCHQMTPFLAVNSGSLTWPPCQPVCVCTCVGG